MEMRVCDKCHISNEECIRRGYGHVQNIHINTTNIGIEFDCDLCPHHRAELLNLIREFVQKKEGAKA